MGVVSADEALRRARRHAQGPDRFLLGITGPPGSGKSTLTARIQVELGDAVRVAAMDGFHLAQTELERLGRADRKGAPDTFDAAGYVALLRRLRDRSDAVVYAPEFRRDLEEPVGSAAPIPRAVPLVVTEGNYLLLLDGAWSGVRALLDAVWFVSTPPDLRRERLVARHAAFGKDPERARAWALGPDERNAELIEATRERADLVVELGRAPAAQ